MEYTSNQIKKNDKISKCDRLDFETLELRPIIPKKAPQDSGHFRDLAQMFRNLHFGHLIFFNPCINCMEIVYHLQKHTTKLGPNCNTYV